MNTKFKKGQSGNPGGRPKGTQNKSTTELREFFTDFLNENKEKLQSDFEKLEAKDRLKFIIEISRFVIPSLKSVDFSGEVETSTIPPIVGMIIK